MAKEKETCGEGQM